MKRILLLATVALLMVMVMAASALPAFAAPPTYDCYDENSNFVSSGWSKKQARHLEQTWDWTCVKVKVKA